ncbi:SDR family oxidoreductase [uncultured Pontibacter sp.]|uniref:SDR family oxidoreductase n=1 Tax=uncultured Pontibacter sp. TaxID=453356 RepID=UPI00260B0769|nr:SDR family oxidoreductase [uncultured Pontibacter sp.]
MKVFITGATGYIGHQLTQELVDRNYEVNALVRSKEKAADLTAIGVKVYEGDLDETQVIDQAMNGVDAVFHLAAYAKLWPNDATIYRRVNVRGTQHVLDAALKHKVKKVVVTSTASVYGPSTSADNPVNEASELKRPFTNLYESTKAEAEQLAQDFVKRGLPVVIVNPSRVYGPGKESDSNGIAKLLRLYLSGKWRIIPGDGKQVGNYCYIDDVVKGHLLALEQGRSGESYLLGGENASYNRLFDLISKLSGKKRFLLHMPPWLLLLASSGLELGARLTYRRPLITPEWARKYLADWSVSSQKAINELGYTITPLQEGLEKTLRSLQEA